MGKFATEGEREVLVITWTNTRVRLSDLKPWADNPRCSTKKQAQKLIDSWNEFGQVETIAIDPSGNVLDGHQRLSALLTIYGMDYEIDARQSSRPLTDDERKKLVVYLHSGAVGSWDWDKIANWDAAKVIDWGMDKDALKDWKRDVTALDTMLKSEQVEPIDAEPQIDKAEELRKKWGVETGQLWQLGDHRIICGDCTDKAVVDRVMQGERANILFTDPPYGVDVVGSAGNIGGDTANAKAGKYSQVIGDDKPFSPAHLFELANISIIWGANYFCLELPCAGQWIVWDKNRPDGTTFSECELAWTNGNGIAIKKYKCTWDGFHREGESGARFHPTQKPVKLSEDIIRDFDGDIIVDCYSGSGTTIIACENLHRKCRAIEISPAYVAVAIQRWVDVTGKTPELIG